MDVKNCKQCGRLFNYVSGVQICPICKKELEEKFTQVKEYIRENPDSPIIDISVECEVSVNQLHVWIREERLILSKTGEQGVNCLRCGELIETGKYCQKCKEEMATELKDGFNIGKKPTLNLTKDKRLDTKGARMRVNDNKFKF